MDYETETMAHNDQLFSLLPFGDKWRFWCKYDPYVIFYDASMARTAECCNIGGYEKNWKHVYKTTEHYHSDETMLDYYPYFPYFRSSFFTANMLRQLELTLHGYIEEMTRLHDWNEFYYDDVDKYENGGQYFCNTLLAAALIYGAYQIQSRMVDSDVLIKTTDYLLKSQLTNGSWWDIRRRTKVNHVMRRY